MLKRLRWSIYLAQRIAAARRADLFDADALLQRQQRNVRRMIHMPIQRFLSMRKQ